jgi:hypothetical protein
VTAVRMAPADATDRPLTMEVVAGVVGQSGHVDGPLNVSQFSAPLHLCQWGDIVVSDTNSHTVRLIEGVMGVAAGQLRTFPLRRLTTAITEIAPVLPKELAALIAEYTPPAVRTIAGTPDVAGASNGHALREAKFNFPCAAAVDDTDPAAGSALILCEGLNHAIRRLHVRSEQISTIAGDCLIAGHIDGPAHDALFDRPTALVIDPSTGVLFVAEQVCAVCPPTSTHRSALPCPCPGLRTVRCLRSHCVSSLSSRCRATSGFAAFLAIKRTAVPAVAGV